MLGIYLVFIQLGYNQFVKKYAKVLGLIQQQQTTTSFFQIKYSLQSLCPQLAKVIRGGYKRKKKIVEIYIYVKRTILEAI